MHSCAAALRRRRRRRHYSTARPTDRYTGACRRDTRPTLPRYTPCQVRGLGRFFNFVNDDTGHILSTGAAYRALLVADTAAFAGPDARTRFYSLNLEHAQVRCRLMNREGAVPAVRPTRPTRPIAAPPHHPPFRLLQSEVNGEVSNASWVDVYSLKAEGNLPLLWIRGGSSNVSVLALGGGVCPFAFNQSFPPDFAQTPPSLFRVDAGTRDVKFAALLDHGYGAGPPFWPPTPGGCHWTHHYPYPGEVIPFYPFCTQPNCTMWNCW